MDVERLQARAPAIAAAGLGLAPALAWSVAAGPAARSFRGLGLFAGFAAAGLLAVSMLLMLRLRALDRAFGGLGHVLRAHHVLGLAAFVLLLAHPLALALDAYLSRPRAALALLVPAPSTGAAFSGWVTLLLFVAFFVVTVTPQVPARAWRQLHRASGLAYGAMVWHLAAAFSGSVAAGLALGLVAAGVLGYAHRLFFEDPAFRGLRYRVAEVRHRGPRLVDLVLEPLGAPLRFDAGQFVYLALKDAPTYRACGELHPYTLTGRPDDPRLRLSVKALGKCTRHMQELVPGVEAVVQGPFGGMFPRSSRRPQVWVGGGIGITPFLGRAAGEGGDGPPVEVVYAAASEGAATYLPELRALAAGRPRLRVHTLFEDEHGLPSVVAIEARTGPLDGKDFVLSGPPAMVHALARQLRARGVPAARIHTEEGVSR